METIRVTWRHLGVVLCAVQDKDDRVIGKVKQFDDGTWLAMAYAPGGWIHPEHWTKQAAKNEVERVLSEMGPATYEFEEE